MTRFAPHLTAALLLAASSLGAQNSALSLRSGLYVRERASCSAPANADILTWDGTGIGGAHTSKCTTKVTGKKGIRYEIVTSCAAQGDGSANPGDKPYVENDEITLFSGERFSIGPANAAKTSYRWCSGIPLR